MAHHRPVPGLNGDGHARSWPPQNEKIDLSKEYDDGRQAVRWQLYRSGSDKIDCRAGHHQRSRRMSATRSAGCTQTSDRRRVQLSVGYAKDIKVYVNRAKVMDADRLDAGRGRASTDPQFLPSGRLERNAGQGAMARLATGPSTWRLSIRRTRKPLTGISYRVHAARGR